MRSCFPLAGWIFETMNFSRSSVPSAPESGRLPDRTGGLGTFCGAISWILWCGLSKPQHWDEHSIWFHTHDGSMYAIYGAPWIPSIYPLYVSIFLPAPWIRHGICLNDWIQIVYGTWESTAVDDARHAQELPPTEMAKLFRNTEDSHRVSHAKCRHTLCIYIYYIYIYVYIPLCSMIYTSCWCTRINIRANHILYMTSIIISTYIFLRV